MGVDQRGERRGEGEPSQIAADAHGPAGFASGSYVEDGDMHRRETRVLAPEAAPNAKRRRIRGKQSRMPAGLPLTAAVAGATRIDVQASRCDEEGDNAADTIVSHLNSLHDDAAADGGSRRDHRAVVPGRSPSRLAVDFSTEQCPSCPGHRDGLQPTARCGPAESSWPARSGRPPDAADAAA